MWKDLELRWKGKAYVIPGNRVTQAIALIEPHMTVTEMMGFLVRGGTPYFKIACCYAELLKFAGVKDVTESDVAARMFGPDSIQEDAAVLVHYLLERIIPPASVNLGAGAASEGKDQPDGRASSGASIRPLSQPAS
jgi:hypothetical protein